MHMTIDSSITDIKGVGGELARKFAVLGIRTAQQLIDYYPRRYDDYSKVHDISRIKSGPVTIKAVIKQAKGRYVRRGMHVTEAVASDETSSVRLVWFNQPYRAASLKPNQEYYISGDFGLRRQHLVIQNPSAELVSAFPLNTARLVPIYRETKGLKSAQIRRIMRELLPVMREMPETIPSWIIDQQQLVDRSKAIEALHFPDSLAGLDAARRRLGFEEVFRLTLAALLNKYELQTETAVSIPFNQKLAKDFVGHLPFTLTDDQRKAVWQIYQDLQRPMPMNRLVEGDVGSGKTVVATMAALMAIEQGFQVALMAPTELLARQHADTIYNLLQPLGMASQMSLLVGSLGAKQKALVHRRIADGQTRFIIGTHALIQDKVDMKNLGLVIVDEQHRFGVDQRKTLQSKAGHAVHVLNMTATPIPRSLALTLYGELDISVIADKPTGRKSIITKLCSPNSRQQLYKTLDSEIEHGRQLFVVCPLVAESDYLPAKSAEQMYQELSVGPFKHRRLGLLHGKMKPAEKEAIMAQFVGHKLDILVATTVVEVGVNVPNASVMLIENPERFGLAQIHQLRGRVGRSDEQGYCYLVLSDSQPPTRRLRALESSSDGFALAELDLEIRGPGAIYGTSQHGQLDLRVAKLTDTRLIAAARQTAQQFIDKGEKLSDFPDLEQHVGRLRAITNLN